MQTHAKVKNVKFCDGSCTLSVKVWKRKFYVQTKIFNILIFKILIVLFAGVLASKNRHFQAFQH